MKTHSLSPFGELIVLVIFCLLVLFFGWYPFTEELPHVWKYAVVKIAWLVAFPGSLVCLVLSIVKSSYPNWDKVRVFAIVLAILFMGLNAGTSANYRQDKKADIHFDKTK